ncbi:MAG: hypothetical protein HQM02_12480 [Magnetococcales bacterium]|nr:hypothetical protein [Magnetococcales bacterium]
MSIKNLLMNGKVVAGVGNIYVAESLFLAGLHPGLPAGGLSRSQCATLVEAIRQVLRAAIDQGGTTLQDFRQSDGRPGDFARQLRVYGREGQPCPVCGDLIAGCRMGQRSAFFCPRCQPPPHKG